MYKFIFICFVFLIFCSRFTFAQTYSISGSVFDSLSKESLPGVRIKILNSKIGAITNAEGHFLISGIIPGSYEIKISRIEYNSVITKITVTSSDSTELMIYLSPLHTEAEEVVISGTRTVRSIDDVPVRVEAIPQEEVEEKILMRPASVSMLLSETPGIRVQNTSGTSNSANLRIQGLDGRYTQILVDGIPSFSGLASGFGITQLLPLNLRQVEIVKGASSALYGADAISGIVNFLTKEPHEEEELTAIVNLTSQKGYDISAFYRGKWNAFGFTTLLSYNHQMMFDVNGDNFTDLAGYSRIAFSPKIEYKLSDGLLATVSSGYFHEKRLGGVMNASESTLGKTGPYLERNISERVNSTLSIDWKIDTERSAMLRAAGTHLDRNSYYGTTPFDAAQTFLFADGFYSLNTGIHSMQVGVAYNSENFSDKTLNISVSRSYLFNDIGAWLQDELSFSQSWKLLGSARIDHHNTYGTFLTPRASILFKESPSLTFRLGGGTGFKAPTIFLEDAELHGFRNVLPISNAVAEQAQSMTFDADYKFIFGDIAAKFNFVLYSTWLEHALIIDADSLANGAIFIRNVTGITLSRGGELTGQFSAGNFKLSISYAYLDTRQTDHSTTEELELNPRHWLGIVLMYENKDAGIKAGLENYFTSPQHLYNNPYRTISPGFWLNGFMIEKAFGSIHLFVNAENIFDVRQTRFEPTFTGNPETGDFHPLHIYAPLEGRAFNGGIRIVF